MRGRETKERDRVNERERDSLDINSYTHIYISMKAFKYSFFIGFNVQYKWTKYRFYENVLLIP